MARYEMPGDVLQTHAYNNVWCTPDQDNQMNYTPARISPINGHWYDFFHMWRKIALPNKVDRFHIYQIGGINPMLLGLSKMGRNWVPLTKMMVNELVVADFFTGNGFQIPRCLVWFLYTDDKNLLVAIQEPGQKLAGWDWEEHQMHFRLYSNEYFNSVRANSTLQYINCISERLMDRQAVATFIDKVAAMPYTTGVKYYFVNGRYSSSVNLAQIDNGDYVDCIYDSSIKKVVDLPLDNLPEFNSTLDTARKLLLHYPGNDGSIEYHDDVDFFVWMTLPGNRSRGTYIHKLDKRTIRMITHRDYSVALNVIESIRANSAFITSGAQLYIRMHIRNSGYKRPLVFEVNRIHELYRLDPELIQPAMLGIDSNVTEWRADVLEAAMYPAIMRALPNTISRQMVQEAYGYHAISKIIGDTPVKTYKKSGQTVADTPIGLIGRATCYEYDSTGKLLGFYRNGNGSIYPCTNPTCALVEMVYGLGGRELDIRDNVATGSLDTANNYRYYWCTNVSGNPDNKWKNAGAGLVHVTASNFTWVVDPSRYTRVLSNYKHLAYEFNYIAQDGLITFNITHDVGGVARKLEHPLGELDIWLNKYLLIEHLDYVVKNMQVFIINKTHLVNGGVGEQNVVVRFKGFCTETFEHRGLDESGFIVHDTVSYNHIYNVREDHVVRVSIGGKVYHRSDVKFAEDGVIPKPIAINNGQPYGVRNTVMPLNNYIVGVAGIVDQTYVLLEQAREVDKRISDYLTLHRPQVDPSDLSFIANKYAIYSPFFTKILCDLRDGLLWDDRFTEHYGNAFVEQMCKPYMYLLDVDPIGGEDRYDDKYVMVQPHPYSNVMMIGVYQHKFLRFVHNLYSHGRVDIANHVQVLPFGS